MILYIDVLMIENFIVNFFLLTVTMSSIRKNTKLSRMIIASLLGSIYVITMIIPKFTFLTKTPFKIGVAIIMVGIISNELNLRSLLKGTIIFLLYSMLLAGIVFYFTITDREYTWVNNYIYDFHWKNLFLALMILFIFINRIVTYIKDRQCIDNFIYNIDVYFENKKNTFKAFLDTGNELREPVTNLPVIIVEKDIFLDLDLSKYVIYNIPYSIVNGDTGVLLGVKPQFANIEINKKIVSRDVIIAFSNRKFSEDNSYKGLLPRGIID